MSDTRNNDSAAVKCLLTLTCKQSYHRMCMTATLFDAC